MLGVIVGTEYGWAFVAYVLCVAGTLLCAAWGIINWTPKRGPGRAEDPRWGDSEGAPSSSSAPSNPER